VNKARPAERLVRLSALSLCALVYAVAISLLFQGLEKESQRSVSVKAVRLSIAQIELQTAPAPEPRPRNELKPEIRPEAEADVALEKVIEEPEPLPQRLSKPEPDVKVPVAQVNQEASAPAFLVDPDDVQGWVLEEIETEKYYPAAAERFGLTGTFGLTIQVDENGTIQSAKVLDGDGHRILRQAVERMLEKIIGRKYSKPIGAPMGFEVEYEFE
jgi:TonB family protein